MSTPSFHIIKIESINDLKSCWALRKEVFVIEQMVDEGIEYEFEEESVHFAAKYKDEIIGTARWRQTENGIKLERFAVNSAYRNKGIGSALVNAILEDIPKGYKVYLHAQAAAEEFYSSLGFIRDGDSFIEAEILHFPMKLG